MDGIRVPSADRINASDEFSEMINTAECLVLVPFSKYILGLLEWRLTQTEQPAEVDIEEIRRFATKISHDGFVGSIDVQCRWPDKVCRVQLQMVPNGYTYQMNLDQYTRPTFATIDRLVNFLFGYYAAVLKQNDKLENALEGVFGTARLSIEPQNRAIYLLPDYPFRVQPIVSYVDKN